MRWQISLIALSITVALAALLSAAPADAKIKCDGPYQINSGNRISTPYCEDNYLAQIAKQYGQHVTGSAIRSNYNLKRRVCELVGHDNRVRTICSVFDRSSRGGCRFTC